MQKLIQQIQWFAETLYEEKVMEHYEGCSMETIRNSLNVYKSWNVIKIEKKKVKKEELSTEEELVSILVNED